jgi:hypothetical protein
MPSAALVGRVEAVWEAMEAEAEAQLAGGATGAGAAPGADG